MSQITGVWFDEAASIPTLALDMLTKKCEGIGCSKRDQCNRFTRPAVDGQQWASFYAMGAAAMQLECEAFVSNEVVV